MASDTPENPAAGQSDDASGKTRFAAVADVLEHLAAEGWKVAPASLYRHAKEGKLLPDSDGTYSVRAVDKYARTYLKQRSTGKKVGEKMDELQRRKIETDIAVAEIARKRNQFAFEREQKLWISRSEVDLEFAARAGFIDAGLTHWIKSHAAGWIRLVGGDMAKVGELISQMNREKDEHINGYATAPEFDVVFEGDGGAEASEEMVEGEEPC